MPITRTNASDERHAREIANLAAISALPNANLSMQEVRDHISRLVEAER